MRRRHVTLALCVTLFLTALYFLFVWPIHKKFIAFDNIERDAKRVITGAELQAWATNLLASISSTTTPIRVSGLGTNFPSQLLNLNDGTRPYIYIHRESDTNFPPCVRLTWGGGMIGHCGFDIGPTNHVNYRYRYAREWQSGVYFWSEFPLK
jgi:hypothetical protein